MAPISTTIFYIRGLFKNEKMRSGNSCEAYLIELNYAEAAEVVPKGAIQKIPSWLKHETFCKVLGGTIVNMMCTKKTCTHIYIYKLKSDIRVLPPISKLSVVGWLFPCFNQKDIPFHIPARYVLLTKFLCFGFLRTLHEKTYV